MAIVLLVATIYLCLGYQTTITSNYTEPAPTPPPPSTPDPPLQVGTITIVDTTKLMNFLQYIRNSTFTFDEAFTSTPEAIVTLEGLVDDNTRYGVNFQLSIAAIDINKAVVSYTDYSGPGSWTNTKLLKVRVLAYNTATFPNMKANYKEFDISASPHSESIPWSIGNAADLTAGLNVIPFITKMVFSPSTSVYYVRPVIALGVSTLYCIINVGFPNNLSANKKIGISFLFFLPNSTWTSVYASLTTTATQKINTQLAPNLYLIIGLVEFTHYNYAPFEYSIVEEGTVLEMPDALLNYYYLALYLIINDTASAIPPPPPRPETFYSFNLTRVESFSTINITFKMVYENIPAIGDVDKSQIKLSSSNIWIDSVYTVGNNLEIICGYNQQLQGNGLTVELTWTSNQIQFKATTPLTLSTNPPLLVYPAIGRGNILGKICQGVQYAYLAGFLISLLSRKLVGVELMAFIQLAFFCQIPLNVSNPLYNAFKKMTHSSGFNVFLPGVMNVPLTKDYSSLGIYSNFICNVNIMLIPIVVCPIMSGLLLLAYRLNTSYKLKPRFKKYALAFIFQWPLTVILFNSYNIFVSLVVNFQSLGNEDPGALAVGVIAALLSPILGTLYALARSKYDEFKYQLNFSTKIGCLTEQASVRLCQMYPLVLAIESMLIPVFLANSSFFNSSLYIALAITLTVTIYICATLPYLQKLNNIRLLIHRALVTLLVVGYIVSKAKISNDTDIEDPVLNLAFMILAVLVLDWILNFAYITCTLISWFNRPGIVDMKLYVQEKGVEQKPQVIGDIEDPIWYPMIQFGKEKQSKANVQPENRWIHRRRSKYSKQYFTRLHFCPPPSQEVDPPGDQNQQQMLH